MDQTTRTGDRARTTTRQDLTLELALRLIDGACQEAARREVSMGLAVVDTGGCVIASARMDGAQLVAVDLAVDKAYTAVAFGQPTEAWAASTQPGGADWGLSTTLGGRLVVFAGGLPVHVDGQVVGAIGVSGSAAEVDRAVAQAGIAAVGLAG